MEILLAIAGLTGLAFLLQSKALPSEEDFAQAKEKLKVNPADPDANTTAGKYLAFVLGDYPAAMPFLVLSGDATLAQLAEHESNPKYAATSVQKVGMGDEWVLAGKKFPQLSNIFYDRANQWYILAWPGLEEAWQIKSRAQGRKIATSRPQGVVRKGAVPGWVPDIGVAGRPWIVDGSVARTGSYSAKIPAADDKTVGSASVIRSALIPVTGKSMEASAYVLADGTENAADRLFVVLFDNNARQKNILSVYLPVDLPFWNRVTIKTDLPANIARMQIGVANYSKQGNMWVDDASVKFDGKEALKNPSFEER